MYSYGYLWQNWWHHHWWSSSLLLFSSVFSIYLEKYSVLVYPHLLRVFSFRRLSRSYFKMNAKWMRSLQKKTIKWYASKWKDSWSFYFIRPSSTGLWLNMDHFFFLIFLFFLLATILLGKKRKGTSECVPNRSRATRRSLKAEQYAQVSNWISGPTLCRVNRTGRGPSRQTERRSGRCQWIGSFRCSFRHWRFPLCDIFTEPSSNYQGRRHCGPTASATPLSSAKTRGRVNNTVPFFHENKVPVIIIDSNQRLSYLNDGRSWTTIIAII